MVKVKSPSTEELDGLVALLGRRVGRLRRRLRGARRRSSLRLVE
jgi:hypothetical protein